MAPRFFRSVDRSILHANLSSPDHKKTPPPAGSFMAQPWPPHPMGGGSKTGIALGIMDSGA